MIFKKNGIDLKKNTKTNFWWIKLGLVLILSNIFFFMLFSSDEPSLETKKNIIPNGHVEINIKAELMTPFESGKKVLIINRNKRKKIEGFLKALHMEEMEKITVQVNENKINELIKSDSWEIIPFTSQLSFFTPTKDFDHEIHY